MNENQESSETNFSCNRRKFAQLTLAALPAVNLFTVMSRLAAAEAPATAAGKPNSKVTGVQLGLNVPYSFGNLQMSGDEILKNCLQLNCSAVELRTQPVESFLGAPANLLFPKKGASADDQKAAAEKLREWRRSATVARAGDFRKTYETAGVLIEIVKVDNIFKMSDEELNFTFDLAKTLGARALSTEISNKEDDLKRLGEFADKHQFMVGYHGHTATGPEQWEKAFSLGKYNGANVDIGHFIAGFNTSPLPFIEKYHERITHVHLKDRKFHNGENTPFGEGDTPIVDVLHAIRDNKWKIQGTIEFEYKVPAGSDRMTEIRRALDYCRKALA